MGLKPHQWLTLRLTLSDVMQNRNDKDVLLRPKDDESDEGWSPERASMIPRQRVGQLTPRVPSAFISRLELRPAGTLAKYQVKM